MKIKWDDKDPNEVEPFYLDWTPRLTSDTVTGSTWEVNPATGTIPLAIGLTQFTTAISTVWLSGGDDGGDYELTNHVVTSTGRNLDQTVKLRVRSR